jgi:hypothetical protein
LRWASSSRLQKRGHRVGSKSLWKVSAASASPRSWFSATGCSFSIVGGHLLLQIRLPSMFANTEHVEAGGLMAYSTSSRENYRRAAHCVDKILKGAKPADLRLSSSRRNSNCDQHEDREAPGLDGSAGIVATSESGHQMTGRALVARMASNSRSPSMCPSSRAAGQRADDEAAIRKVMDAMTTAFNTHDEEAVRSR